MLVYGYKNTKDILMKTSSGGAFVKIVEILHNIYGNKLIVYGAAWSDSLTVKHCRIISIKDVNKISGSKYSQSDIRGIFSEVKEDLNKGYIVLFSGTPCQVNALNSFLKKNEVSLSNLITLDVICHGTPKPIVLSDYINWMETLEKDRIESINFRDKEVSWHGYPTTVKFQHRNTKVYSFKTQLYMKMYFSLLIIEKKCFNCHFSNLNRVSDITLGDYWGIEKIDPTFPAQNGVSLILFNSKKGEMILEYMTKSISDDEIFKKSKKMSFLNYQNNLNRPTQKPQMYEEFWIDYNVEGFEFILKKYGFLSWNKKIRFSLKKLLFLLKKHRLIG